MTDEPACEEMQPGQGWHAQVLWCPAWGQWLCADCRLKRNDAELRRPAGAKPELSPAREFAGPVLQL